LTLDPGQKVYNRQFSQYDDQTGVIQHWI